MPARLNPKQDERCRDAIQTTQLLRRLNAFALGHRDPAGGNSANPEAPCQMSEGQIRAAVALLRKTIPDLAVTAHVGEDGGPIRIVTGVIRDGE
jgi:hypothetical protein